MSEIAADFREFLHIRIENIERLRVLLLMHKEAVEWTVDALSSRLYIPPDKVLTELQSLRDQEFISESTDTTQPQVRKVSSPH